MNDTLDPAFANSMLELHTYARSSLAHRLVLLAVAAETCNAVASESRGRVSKNLNTLGNMSERMVCLYSRDKAFRVTDLIPRSKDSPTGFQAATFCFGAQLFVEEWEGSSRSTATINVVDNAALVPIEVHRLVPAAIRLINDEATSAARCQVAARLFFPSVSLNAVNYPPYLVDEFSNEAESQNSTADVGLAATSQALSALNEQQMLEVLHKMNDSDRGVLASALKRSSAAFEPDVDPDTAKRSGTQSLDHLIQRLQKAIEEKRKHNDQRDAWLRTTAQPLLDDLRAAKLHDLFSQFRDEAYDLSELMETAQVAEALGIDASLVQRYARQGRLGRQFSRTYVFSAPEVDAFSSRPRSVGRPASK